MVCNSAPIPKRDFSKLTMPLTIQDELRKRLGLPADYNPSTDAANLISREFIKRVALAPVSLNPEIVVLFKRMAWTLLDQNQKTTTTGGAAA